MLPHAWEWAIGIAKCCGLSLFSFLEDQECNLLWLLVLFSVYELFKQDFYWRGPCRMAPEGFRHRCFSIPRNGFSSAVICRKESVFIEKQRIKDQNIEVKWETNETKWKTSIPGWPQCCLPHSSIPATTGFLPAFSFPGFRVNWQLLALLSYLCKQCLNNPSSSWARDISEKKQVGFNQTQHLQMESHGRWEKADHR